VDLDQKIQYLIIEFSVNFFGKLDSIENTGTDPVRSCNKCTHTHTQCGRTSSKTLHAPSRAPLLLPLLSFLTNGITIVFVVRLQSTLTISGGMDSAFVSFQRNDEHHALSLNLRMVGGIWNMCLSTYSGETCARADAPLNTWIKFFYTYHPSALPRGNIRVEYTSSSVQ